MNSRYWRVNIFANTMLGSLANSPLSSAASIRGEIFVRSDMPSSVACASSRAAFSAWPKSRAVIFVRAIIGRSLYVVPRTSRGGGVAGSARAGTARGEAGGGVPERRGEVGRRSQPGELGRRQRRQEAERHAERHRPRSHGGADDLAPRPPARVADQGEDAARVLVGDQEPHRLRLGELRVVE